MAAMDRIVGTRRESLKASWFVFSQLAPQRATEHRLGRVVSDRFEEKGRTHARVCTEEGVMDLELQKRDRSSENEAFRQVHRYDLLEIGPAAKAGKRQRLTPDSRCKVIDETSS